MTLDEGTRVNQLIAEGMSREDAVDTIYRDRDKTQDLYYTVNTRRD